jgi:hypothetical protein
VSCASALDAIAVNSGPAITNLSTKLLDTNCIPGPFEQISTTCCKEILLKIMLFGPTNTPGKSATIRPQKANLLELPLSNLFSYRSIARFDWNTIMAPASTQVLRQGEFVLQLFYVVKPVQAR